MAADPSAPAILPGALDGATVSTVERRTLERIVALFSKEFGEDLHAVWLYGSRARGEQPGPDSDVDLMVIADGGWDRYESTAIDLIDLAAQAEKTDPVPYAVFVHDPDWLRGRREIRSFFIQEVDRDKIVLYGSGL